MDETKARALAAYPYGKPGEGEPSEITETRDALAKRILAFAAEIRRDERERAARIARDGCLVPPDGGSPTTEEFEMCERIAAAIRALSDAPGGPDPTVTLAETLRETALDLSRVPEGWEFNLLSFTPQYAPERSWQAVISRIKPVGHSNGTGPTPRAALDAAIARANEYGETK